jgi:hypothetical protein
MRGQLRASIPIKLQLQYQQKPEYSAGVTRGLGSSAE